MDRARKSARGNRWGLSALGLALLAGGGAALAAGLGVFGAGAAATPLTGGTAWATAPWVPYAVAAVATAVVLVALRWLLVQGRGDAVGRLRMESDPGEGITEIPSPALCRALEGEVEACPGVRRARAHLTGSPYQPGVRLDLVLDEDADAAALWRRCGDEALGRLRDSVQASRLPAVLRISMTPPPRQPRRSLA